MITDDNFDTDAGAEPGDRAITFLLLGFILLLAVIVWALVMRGGSDLIIIAFGGACVIYWCRKAWGLRRHIQVWRQVRELRKELNERPN